MMLTTETQIKTLPLGSINLPPLRVELYDTTLREDLHDQRIHFRPDCKLRIVHKLLDLGVEFVEAGFAQADSEELKFFISRLMKDPRARERLVPLGLKGTPDAPPICDTGLAALLAYETKSVAIVGKTSAAMAKTVFHHDSEENLEQIQATIQFLTEEGRAVLFLADDFFEVYHADRAYALRVLDAARSGGATRLVLCDTNGGSLPTQIRDAVTDVRGHLNRGTGKVILGFHGCNNCGLAQANALAAVEGGAVHVQASVNGLGDRGGSIHLITLAANLALKMGREVLAEGCLQRLGELSRLVRVAANLSYRSEQPHVGYFAFAHERGNHATDSPAHLSHPYEHMLPAVVSGQCQPLISLMDEGKAVLAKFNGFGLSLSDVVAEKVFYKVKRLEKDEGWQFDDAQASLYLLGLKELGGYEPWFIVKSYSVLVRQSQNSPLHGEVEAAVKLIVSGQAGMVHTVAGGTGPLNALDNALRKALEPNNPGLKRVKLFDYTVRGIEGPHGTAGRVHVSLKTRRWDHDARQYQEWGTCGVSQNLVEATWMALIDSLYFWKLLEEKSVLKKHFTDLINTSNDA